MLEVEFTYIIFKYNAIMWKWDKEKRNCKSINALEYGTYYCTNSKNGHFWWQWSYWETQACNISIRKISQYINLHEIYFGDSSHLEFDYVPSILNRQYVLKTRMKGNHEQIERREWDSKSSLLHFFCSFAFWSF